MSSKKRTLLIVGNGKSVSKPLTQFGYEVVTAESGEEALGKLQEVDCDLLITEIRMQGMGGIELLKEAKQTKPNIEVVIVTAYGEVESYLEAMNLGAFEYINKPFELDELKQAISRIFREEDTTALN